MRVPIRSETEAFRFALAAAATLGVAVLVGVVASPLAGVAVFAAAALVAAVAYLRAPNPDRATPLRDAARAPHAGADGRRHLLVVANEVPSGAEIEERIAAARREGVEVDVLAPVLTSHARMGVSDVDDGLREARARLDRSLAWMREHGVEVRGSVGDPSPTTAIADELRAFGADEVIVVTHPSERETWQERGELERLRGELDVPVTHLVALAS